MAETSEPILRHSHSQFHPIIRVRRTGLLPLSFAQQRLWFLAHIDDLSRAYHVWWAVRLEGELNVEALRRALKEIVRRHEVLRTTFKSVDGRPAQRIASVDESYFLLLEHDLREVDVDREIERVLEEENGIGFDLERGPLIRGRLVREGNNLHTLLITMHHIISDGWSKAVLERELSALYRAFTLGEMHALPELEVQYADYAVWQRKWMEEEILSRQAEYWKETLEGVPELLELPADRGRPAEQDLSGDRVGVVLDGNLTRKLKELSQRHGTTLHMTLLAGWAGVLGRLSGQTDIVIGTPVANRNRLEIENLIGFFVNTLALRVDVSGAPTVSQLLGRVKAQALGGQQHQDIPFERVVELVRPVRSLAHSPVFQVMFGWQSTNETTLRLAGLQVHPLRMTARATAKFDLSLSLQEAGGRIVGTVEYATSLFERARIERYWGYYRRVLEGMVSGDGQVVEDLPMMEEEERQKIVYEWNRTEAEYPAQECVHELFERQVEKTREAVAVVAGEVTLSYGELNRRANQLGHYLREQGVGPDARVAICMERSAEMVVGLLGVMKAGGAYVPMDPANPSERLRYMVNDSEPVAVLTQGDLKGLFADMNPLRPVIDMSGEPVWRDRPETNLERMGLKPEHLAYVIYTSGSTGAPKGVMVEHRSLSNTLVVTGRDIQIEGGDRTAFVSGQAFDISLWEILTALLVGGNVEIWKREQVLDVKKVRELLKAITVLHAVPTLMSEIVRIAEEGEEIGIRQALTGGDRVSGELVDRMRKAFRRAGIRVLYGPTETAILAAGCENRKEDGKRRTPPIGRPIANTRMYILDGRGEPVPVGVTGELYIGGAGVARGYQRSAERTAERFVADPFVAGERMYRTGDQGRWLEDGNIEFMGRNDFQVKIRGFRIELGEIEARLMEHDEVREAVVVAKDEGSGDKRLIAYYTVEGEVEGIGAEQLRAHVVKQLPEYMVPAAYVRLEKLPLTANGKLDRKGLPEPEAGAYVARGYEAPVGEMEAAVAAIWGEVLKLERVGRHDNFFELGGHSLVAVRVMTRLQQTLGVEVTIRDLFGKPVLLELAQVLEKAARVALPAIGRVDRGSRIPLSFAQQRLWFLAQMKGVSETYHIPFGVRLEGELDGMALRTGLEEIVRRHEALRTRFEWVEGEAVQRIESAEQRGFRLVEEDLRGAEKVSDEVQLRMMEESGAEFDLQRGPLIRGRLMRVGEQEHVLLMTMHHIVSDGWSMGVMLKELSALYSAGVRGEEAELPELEVQYADYAVWQRKWMEEEILSRQAEYWKETLEGVPELLELPADRGRPAEQDFSGDRVGVVLDGNLTGKLKELSQRHGATLHMTLLAGWAAVLGRLSGQTDIAIGTPVANRNRLEIENLIGFFVNTLALRVDVSGAPTVSQLLGRVKAQALGGQQNQDIPFERVVELARPVRSLAHSPVFQVMFGWQSTNETTLRLAGLQVHPLRMTARATAKFDLSLSLQEAGGRIVGTVEYATSLFERARIERYWGYYRRVLEGMVSGDGQVVEDLPMMEEEERQKIVYEWNRTEAEYPARECVHEVFERQVEKTPEAVAVVAGEVTLSYGELNRRANQLGHYLREQGVLPDARVAICMERSAEMVVGLLGVMKAGGAYVPMDPANPSERLRYMLNDSEPVAVLTQGDLKGLFADMNPLRPVIDMSGEPVWRDRPETNLERMGLKPEHLAYVIYTSGSTGAPKGVMVLQRGINRLVVNNGYAKFEVGDRVALASNPAFDAATMEMWGPLLNGGTAVAIEQRVVLDPTLFGKAIGEQKVNILWLTVGLFNQYVDGISKHFSDLKYLIVGGDALDVGVIVRVIQGEVPEHLINGYGPTETTTFASTYEIAGVAENAGSIPIGRPIANTRIYILDGRGEPVPAGVTGELYIGGAGVARGYQRSAERTAERFVADPFVAGERMYRTGDQGRWLEDGNIEFMGRNDFQVKIRGFRIELGEIEARLMEHDEVREAVVVAKDEGSGDKRLIAYYTVEGEVEGIGAGQLRAHVVKQLPEYMVPAAYVRLEKLPLTANGKLDRKGLPEPEAGAYVARGYEAPVGEMEAAVAAIWGEVLKLERVGRHDNFFELGGHSLVSVTVIERMRRIGLQLDVRTMFAKPTVAGLAASMSGEEKAVEVPGNRIPEGCREITPEMVVLIALTVEEIERIVGTVLGGAENIQDIYPLAPLQEGILFHHLMGGEGDPYLLANQIVFENRKRLDAYIEAMQAVVDRHDILRTSVIWEGLTEPVQVVWQRAELTVEEVELDADVARRLYERFHPRRYRMDVKQAPLMRIYVAEEKDSGRWVMLQLRHHLTGDHTTLEVMQEEIEAHLQGEADRLPVPLPFRNLIAEARLGVGREEHEAYFRQLLADVEEPTAPFGLMDVRGDGTGIKEARMQVDEAVGKRIREQARRLGVSAASICHVAWAQVVGRTSGREDVVFGTVLFGRMQGGEGSDRVMGLFINTLPVRIAIGKSAESSVRGTHGQLSELLRHEHASLAVAQRCSGVPAPTPLFTSLLNYRHSGSSPKRPGERKREWEGVRAVYGEERTNYPLTFSLDDLGNSFRLTAQVQEPIGALRVCQYMHMALKRLVEALEDSPETVVSVLDVMPEEERQKIVYEWNRTEAEYPAQECVHELFERQVEKTPEAVAVVAGEVTLSYGELNRRANQLGHYLRERGVVPDARVAICMERSAEMVVGLLGVMKAGGAYVPMDPAYPTERLRYMLNDSEPVAVLTQGDLKGLFEGLAVPVIDIGDEEIWAAEQDERNLDRVEVGLKARHLAYVIYTSGSTGMPRGVMVEHAQVSRLFGATDAWFQFNRNDVWTGFHSFAFDFSVWEMWGALLYGGRLIVVGKEEARSPEEFYRLICEQRVTILNQTPSAFRQLAAAQIGSGRSHQLREVIFGGEALEVVTLKSWYEHNAGRACRLINMYGITETTVHVTYRPLEQADVERRGGSPIGRRIPDLRMYILDGRGEPVPVGVTGELYIGGAGVARGYQGSAERTAERFVADPFVAGERMYRTGDRGRWLEDGNIEFIGRNDFQVKIRGFRIELGEIETRLMQHDEVREAVVVAKDEGSGDKRLIAYYTVEGEVDGIGAAQLRAHVVKQLPEYMVPAAYVKLEKLPLTANGKLDRKGLPEPEAGAYVARGYEAPVGEMEAAVAAIWREVLKLERVGRYDNFFELGGHSLVSVTVIERMRRIGLQLDVRTMFTKPTVAGLAASISGEEKAVEVPGNRILEGCREITPEMVALIALTVEEIERIVGTVLGGAENIQDIYPLAPLQEGILFHHLMGGDGDPYLLANQIVFENRKRLDAYIEAMQAVVDRHDILRTSIIWEGLTEPVQVVWRRAELTVEEVELDADVARRLYERFHPRRYRMDVKQAPLMRIYVAEEKDSGRWVMLQLRHHLTGDHTTLGVMQEEIEAHLQGQADRLPVPLPFRNLIAEARLGVGREEHEAYFRQLLADVEEPTAPFGLMDVRGDGTGIKEARMQVDEAVGKRIREQARRLGVSAASICHVAWAQVVGRTSGREDVVFGTVLFGRMQGGEGSDRVMGLFINTLPVRIAIGKSAESSVRGTHGQLSELMRHEHASLAVAQRCSGVPTPTPLFTSLLNYRHSGFSPKRPGERKRELEGVRAVYGEERTNYPLTFSLDDLGNSFRLTAQVQEPIGALRVCQYMHMALERLVEALEDSPETVVSALDVMPEEERQKIVYEWNRTEAEYPAQECVHEVFERQAEKTREAVAVVAGEVTLSYGELNRRANQLGHYLRELGVGPDARVAICMERSAEMVVGLLGVMKAGGAYVPMDPANPWERLRYMVNDSEPVAVLTQGDLKGLFADMNPLRPVIDMSGEPVWRDRPETNLERMGLKPEHLAYVIYTSGSTGAPKGVMVEHRSLSNTLVVTGRDIQIEGGDRTAFVSGQAFDISLWEILTALLVGGNVEIWKREQVLDVKKVRELLKAITVLHAVPTLMSEIVRIAEEGEEIGIRQALTGGDRVSGELVDRMRKAFRRAGIRVLYGPTETAILAAGCENRKEDGKRRTPPIGRAIANTRIYILDGRGEPVPVGVTGELYIGGAGVARGYQRSAERTAERFVADPFVAGERMYRTGDQGRWLEDGNIEFMGRNDFQVKIRGFRIELGEIEARLMEHDEVREAVVVAKDEGSGDKRLIAYYTVEGEVEGIGAEQLRAHVVKQLPEYMVPVAYVRLEKLPLTANGKLDRKGLPEPEAGAYVARGYEAPVGEMEAAVAAIWGEVLKLERVGRHDNFFELGGHSLVAVRVMTRLQQTLGVEVTIRDLFGKPVLLELAQVLEKAVRVALPAIGRVDRGSRIPLSFAQQRLWFLAQMKGVSETYHIPFGVRLEGELDGMALRTGLEEIVRRHEALRTRFEWVDGEAVQRIEPAEQRGFRLVEEDLRGAEKESDEVRLRMMEESGAEFDLQRGPLIRGRLMRVGEQEHVLLMTMHHIVSDGWSMGVMLKELSALYSAGVRGEEAELPELEVQYADYAVSQRKWMEEEILSRQAEYWKETLEGVPELLELPADRGRPAEQDFSGDRVGVVLDGNLTGKLKELSQRHGTTLHMTLLAGWAAVLGRLSGQTDIVIGTPVANRNRLEIENLIGFFVNTLALRVDVSGAPTVSQLLGRVKAQALGGQQHQDIPFERVVELVRPVRSLAHSPVFQVMFGWQSTNETTLRLAGLQVHPLRMTARATAKFDLSLSLQEAGGRIVGTVEYATSLFERARIERYWGYYRRVLEGMVSGDGQVVEDLPMMEEEERQKIVYEWNRTEAEYPAQECVHELFERQVEKTREAVAVVAGEVTLSYGELNRRANQLGHYLREQGVLPDARVAICMERSAEMVVGLLGVMKAGGAYVPMDPANPSERLRYMVNDSEPVAVLTQGDLKGLFADMNPLRPVIDMSGEPVWRDRPETNLERMGLKPEHLAYVIYTSGSTGAPKGVMVEHRSLSNTLVVTGRDIQIEGGDRTAFVSGQAFDISLWEILTALLVGGNVEIWKREQVLDVKKVRELLKAITVLHAVPTLMSEIVRIAEEGEEIGIRQALTGGDRVSGELVDRMRKAFRRAGIRVLYGPTETAILAAGCENRKEDGKRRTPPIGRAIANTRIYILDGRGEPVPVGVTGELYIGGAGVARGYQRSAERTAERFVADPFVAGERMYRTGDQGRWLEDGNIEFMGRNDFQVKIRGFRIELGEIEARLMEHDEVREAVVVAKDEGSGDKRLIAYYTVEGEVEGIGAEQLRAHVVKQLPEYMVPVAYVRLEKLPLTANGKLDRKGLPEPEAGAYVARGYEAPVGEMEAAVAAIWGEVLKLERVGRHDNFFELGGHSLVAVRVMTRLQQTLGVEVTIRDLFGKPVLLELAQVLEKAVRVALPAIGRVDRGSRIPLSFAQQRLWFLAQMKGVSETYHIPFGVRLEGELDGMALRTGLEEIVRRHEALRTRFEWVEGEAVQRIESAEQRGFRLVEEDLRGAEKVSDEVQLRMMEESGAEFDLQRGPLIRGRLMRVGEQEHVLLMTMHHIVSDGWSMGVMLKELSALYSAGVRGEEAELPELEVQYADYAVWQRKWMEEEILSRQAEYWKETLEGVPELLELPADRGRPAEQDFSGDRVGVVLDGNLTGKLKELSQRHGTTLHMTLMAGWAAVLGRLSGQTDIVIGTPVANRNRLEIENLIGFFVNTLALRVDVSGAPTVSQLLGRVKAQALGGQQNQDIPFERVVELARPVRSLAHSPVFQVMFGWQSTNETTLRLAGLQVHPLRMTARATAKFDLSLSLQEAGGRIVGTVEYATSLFERARIERYWGYYRRVLEGMVSGDGQVVEDLPMMEEEERQKIVYEWNRTEEEYPARECVHEVFERQVEKTREAVAVVAGEVTLSYGELNRRANQLGHYLREQGVLPDARVAICMERSAEMVVGLLGVMKAGGAYVPMDPANPSERLRYMVNDSEPVAVLTQGDLKGLFADMNPLRPVIDMSDEPVWRDRPETNLERMGLKPEHLAYVIYTSGSTGAPKGVMVLQRGINRLVVNNGYAKFEVGDRVALASNPAFDAATMEMWGPLLNGGTAVAIEQRVVLDPTLFGKAIGEQKVNILWLTVGLFNQYVDGISKHFSDLKYLIVGGDALDVGVIVRAIQGEVPEHLINGYGPTETTTFASTYEIAGVAENAGSIPIGRPIANTRIYILDGRGEPVPVGVTGELYIGGAGVARGYQRSAERTAERFVADPFVAGERMYRTGDQGRWLEDGNIEFMGRNDFQVKIRGFRIELGEIEARLMEHDEVREAVVVAKDEGSGDKRLIAYYTVEGEVEGIGAGQLRAHVVKQLPEYMVPAAYVRLEKLPLTANGKLDRKGLPEPEAGAYVARGYEAPVGEMEAAVAAIWGEVLKLERVGRHDNFFELGGHSLVSVTVIERMRRIGLQLDVRTMFAKPTVAGLAASMSGEEKAVEVPGNRIPEGCREITPEMVVLIALTVEEIERIVGTVLGGAENIQDIYPLAPLQEGILFHHLMGGEGDPYLLANQIVFENRKRLDVYIEAMQAVVDRHDILRTSVIWEGLTEPVQVVWRRAELTVEEVELDADVARRLYERFHPRRYRMDVKQAPLMRIYVAEEKDSGRWVMLQLRHHLTGDHTTLEVMQEEIEAHLQGEADRLPVPLPFRNLIAEARLGVGREEHEAYFRQLLADVEEPTAPFGLMDVRGDGTGIKEARMQVDEAVGKRIREQARRLGVSAASICHVAWAQVVGRTSGREDVVFGTVLFGRMQGGEGSDRVMGLFINTLPVRIAIGKSAESSVRGTHGQLSELLRHEHASLAVAQRCSGVPAPTPLFTSLLNYRHSGSSPKRPGERKREWEGVRAVYGEERTNYPLTFSLDDLGNSFRLTAQVQEPIGALRVCQYMHMALKRLVEALEDSPETVVSVLDVMPEEERQKIVYEWNRTEAEYPAQECVHELFERQVEKTPEAVAVVAGEVTLSYGELNRRANQLGHYLRERGVVPDARVAICMERSAEMVVGLLGVMKAGGAYVPMDPAYPTERLRYMLNDSEPVAVLTQGDLKGLFEGLVEGLLVIDLGEAERWAEESENNPEQSVVRLMPEHLAYVIYTSGSTGTPKGVMVGHRGISNLVMAPMKGFEEGAPARFLQFASFSFDACVWEVFMALCRGAVLYMDGRGKRLEELAGTVGERGITHALLPPAVCASLQDRTDLEGVKTLIVGGDTLTASLVRKWGVGRQLINAYGPTEATVCATLYACGPDEPGKPPIGRAIANTRMYILDGRGEPVPVGVTGELYIGGAGVARGYQRSAERTAERFVADPFVAGERMYRTGDQGRWLEDGNIEFMGRNDFQVKIRGFRIELGEIEARLMEHDEVREAVVVAKDEGSGDKRLIAYYTVEGEMEGIGAEQLRAHVVKQLPEYMVPAAYVRLEKLPLTANGKLDRKGLPEPEAGAYVARGYEAPVGEMEAAVAAIWGEVLKLERVGRYDNFFELGGHSLVALQIIQRIRHIYQTKIGLDTVFAFPVLASLAEEILRAQLDQFDPEDLERVLKAMKLEHDSRS